MLKLALEFILNVCCILFSIGKKNINLIFINLHKTYLKVLLRSFKVFTSFILFKKFQI